ncbi:hypothetical protein D3C80_1502800 [compost metagenome]
MFILLLLYISHHLGHILVQVPVYSSISIWVLHIQAIAITCMGYGNAADKAVCCSEYRKVFLVVGFEIDAGMEMIGAAFGKAAGQLHRDL